LWRQNSKKPTKAKPPHLRSSISGTDSSTLSQGLKISGCYGSNSKKPPKITQPLHLSSSSSGEGSTKPILHVLTSKQQVLVASCISATRLRPLAQCKQQR
jgi:hypothetical protein